MTSITELYQLLFGRSNIKDGSVIEMSEHGREGGVSTGEGYKKVGILEMSPTDPSKTNPSLVVSYNTAGDVVKIEKIIGSTTYTKTISNDDEVVSRTKTISVWS